jgi:hypothetical protein
MSRQLEFQPSDLGLGGQRILRHRANDPLQRGQIVGQIVGCDRHAGSGSDLQPFWSMIEMTCRSLRWPSQLLADITAGRVGIVVGYKIDRLTRRNRRRPEALGESARARSSSLRRSQTRVGRSTTVDNGIASLQRAPMIRRRGAGCIGRPEGRVHVC